jgi:hypothetical protein
VETRLLAHRLRISPSYLSDQEYLRENLCLLDNIAVEQGVEMEETLREFARDLHVVFAHSLSLAGVGIQALFYAEVGSLFYQFLYLREATPSPRLSSVPVSVLYDFVDEATAALEYHPRAAVEVIFGLTLFYRFLERMGIPVDSERIIQALKESRSV